jgi:HSP20 family protein
MSIVRWNRHFPSFFDEEWPQIVWPDVSAPSGLDIYETDDAVVVEAQVPGVPEDKVDVSIEGNVITICASHEETEEEKKKKKTVYKQTRQTSFNYSTNLPRMVDASKAKAEVDSGVVRVTVPKAEEEKPKKIEVKKKTS